MDKKNIKVLLIEDNLGDARLIQELLLEVKDENFEIEIADQLSKGLNLLAEGGFDIILTDLGLPETQGLDTFVKIYTRVPMIPIIVLTGLNDESIATKAVHEGAQDYLIKGQIDGNLLSRAICYAIERKQTEKELRNAKIFTESIISNVPEVIYSLDREMKVIYISPKCEQLYGYTSDEFKNDPTKLWMEVIHPDDKHMLEPIYEKLTKGESYSFEYRIINKDGNTHWVHDTGNPLLDHEGKIERLEGSIQDITERKRMEEKLKRYAEHLEEEVNNRTNELIQSEKMASIGQMIAGVAHEVNNPLGYINSNIGIIEERIKSLQEMCKEKEILEELNSINELLDTNIKGINRITTITKSLKRFAMPDKGEISPADINQGIKDTLLILNNQLKHRIEVHEDYGKLPEIKCNIGQLNQVFMNLILNSSQAMDKGEIWIKTWFENNNIFIEIKDNGFGIPEDKINKIFDPFFTTKNEGTGLGLSLCYRIIKDYRGDIKLKSKQGKGTQISINLPMEG